MLQARQLAGFTISPANPEFMGSLRVYLFMESYEPIDIHDPIVFTPAPQEVDMVYGMVIPKDVTRVDLLRGDPIGILHARVWHGTNWTLADEEAAEVLYPVGYDSMYQVMDRLNTIGFTVDMVDSMRSRSLRGPIIRVDVIWHKGKGWRVSKYPYGWSARTKPIQDEWKGEEFDVEHAFNWFQQFPIWQVRRWSRGDLIGFRAFKGEIKPVRDRSTILAMRRIAKDRLSHEPDPYWGLDLAFDA